MEGETIPFENLVYTFVTISKTLYAMLLTAAGQLPPPLKTPKHYKSVELNRIKRQCKNGGVAYAHFRHAVEAGVRLALGFEWIMTTPRDADQSQSGGVNHRHRDDHSLISCSAEERIMQHAARVDVEAGGDAEWIKDAWAAGPNATRSEDDINSLIKCPVWNPEVVKGGICPISHPGK